MKKANEVAAQLKNDYACDLVICLSSLGYTYSDNKVQVLAANTRYIDLIIGGHTHTFIE
jgi:5'-nucleotidase